MSASSVSEERLPESLVGRVESDALSALRRKPSCEAQIGGALRVLAQHSARLTGVLGKVTDTMVQRGTLSRPLYLAGVRVLAAHGGDRAVEPLKAALGREDAGGLATLSAACFTSHPELSDAIARVAVRRQPHLAFAAEVARLARGESNGQSITSIAPKIKESHRIALCVELLVPLLWRPAPLPLSIAPALDVLRSAERHLGRWLVFGELVVRAGDDRPLLEAQEKMQEGPSSARAAWALVAWALGGSLSTPPTVRPTAELVARLSDRPSAERDMAFLFRLAAAGVSSTRPMLENLAKGTGKSQETSVRAMPHLIRLCGRNELKDKLREIARNPQKEPLRGLAAAALYDAGEQDDAVELGTSLLGSRQVPSAVWAGLIGLATRGVTQGWVVNEPTFRSAQLGRAE
jgi:hypothetical protein